jgi:hypothetical protein
MKKNLLFLCLCCSYCLNSQTFLNGDFEQNNAVGCLFNLDNPIFNGTMEHTFAFGPNDELDIQTSGCGYAEPPSNDWFVSLSKRPTGDYDAFSMVLSEALLLGESYEVSYWEMSVDTFGNGNIPLHFGLSTEAGEFGDEIYSSLPPINTWAHRSFTFVAPNNGSFFTIKIEDAGNIKAWNFVDGFEISLLSPTNEESSLAAVMVYPNPTSGAFSVELPTGAEKVNIYNAAGQLVQSTHIENTQAVDFMLQDDGIYMVQILTKSGSFVKKLVVDK